MDESCAKRDLLACCKAECALVFPTIENKSGESLRPEKTNILTENDKKVLDKRIEWSLKYDHLVEVPIAERCKVKAYNLQFLVSKQDGSARQIHDGRTANVMF